MQIFLDSADPLEVSKAWETGVIDGITTNPSLAAKTEKSYPETVKQLLSILGEDASISLEVIATDYQGMIDQANQLAQIDNRVVVKIPATNEGIKATKYLSSQGILVNVTLVFTLAQALLAAKAGAYYISPFVGRLNDIEMGTGFEVAEEIAEMLAYYQYQSNLLYASVRDVSYINHAALIGADIITIPFKILEQSFKHQLTDIGLEKFLMDWDKSGLKLPFE